MSQTFKGDVTNNVVELNLQAGATNIGSSSYRLGNTSNGEILTVTKGDFPDYSYGSNPYYNDVNFKGLVIGTSCTSIGNNAFGFCSGLTGSLVIPDSVTSIGSGAFRSCTGLTALYTNTPAASWVGTNALIITTALVNIYEGPDVTGQYSATFQGGSGMTVSAWTNYPNIP